MPAVDVKIDGVNDGGWGLGAVFVTVKTTGVGTPTATSMARIGNSGWVHLEEVPDNDLTTIETPPGTRIVLPTTALGPTQLVPSLPVTASEIALVTFPGRKKKRKAFALVQKSALATISAPIIFFMT